MSGAVYFDCPRNKNGEPIRADQLQRFKANLCVHCGVHEHSLECPERWEEQLAVYGLSRKEITRDDARAFSGVPENEEGEKRESQATAFYRLRSSRERNFAKRYIPDWAFSDGTLLVLMSSYEMSRKTALQTFRAVYEKWRSKEKINASKKDHARLRKHLERLRKDAEALKQELVETGMTPPEVDAYLRDPTLKRLIYPTKWESVYENDRESYEKLKNFADMGKLIALVGREWSSLTRDQQLALTYVEKVAGYIVYETEIREGCRRALEGMPDRSPSDPSSKDLAKFLGITITKSDTYK